MQKRTMILFFLLIPVVLLAACQSTDTVYESVSAATLKPGDAAPAPAGDVVLTLSGKIGTTNAGDTLQFDMETFEKLGLVEYVAVDKYQEGKDVSFRGVLVTDLLAFAKADAAATSLLMTALDGYSVEIPISDVKEFSAIIATSSDGQPLNQAQFGKLRVVYPNKDFEMDSTVYDDRWIWSLTTIDIR